MQAGDQTKTILIVPDSWLEWTDPTAHSKRSAHRSEATGALGKCVCGTHQAAAGDGRVLDAADGRDALRARVVRATAAPPRACTHLLVRALRDAHIADEAVGGRVGRAPLHRARSRSDTRSNVIDRFDSGVARPATRPGIRRCLARFVAVAVNETVAGLDVGGLNPGGAAVEARGQRGRRLDLGDQGLVGANRRTAVTEALRARRNTVHLVHHVLALHIAPVQKFGPASGSFGLF
eukprot:scaffold25595_cov60-Phaeocystis_antarctica.AAC.4